MKETTTVTLQLAVLAIHLAILFPREGVADPTMSTWVPGGMGNDWFDSQRWGAGIPNAPGDVAIIPGSSSLSGMPVVTAPVTLGKLQFSPVGTTGQVSGAGPITFDQPGEASAQIVITPVRTAWAGTVATPIAIATGESLRVDVPFNASLELSGPIMSAGGPVAKYGAGTFRLSGNSPLWEGSLTIEEGEAVVTHNFALGSAAGATLVRPGARLRVQNVSSLAEPIALDNAELIIATNHVQLDGPIDVVASSKITVLTSTTETAAIIDGTISGPGGLTYDVPTSRRVVIAGNNTYEGVTRLTRGGIAAQHAHAFGSPVAGTIILPGAELTVYVPIAEPLIVQGGLVQLASDVTSTGPIRFESGELRLTANGTLTTPIEIVEPASTSHIHGQFTLLTGGITGVGDLYLGGDITVEGQPLSHDGDLVATSGRLSLNVANTFTGETRVAEGRIIVNHPGALGPATSPVIVERGTLSLNVPVDRDFDVTGLLWVETPGVVVSTPVRLGTLPGNPVFHGQIRGVGTFTGGVQMEGMGRFQPSINGGIFDSPISGSVVRLSFRGADTTFLNVDNPYTGLTISQGTRVEANSPGALGDSILGTLVDRGELVLNAPVNEPIVVTEEGKVSVNVQQTQLPRMIPAGVFNPPRKQVLAINHAGSYAERFDLVEGKLEVNSDVTLGGIVVRNSGKVVVAPGATLHVADEPLEFQGGVINGRIDASAIRKTTSQWGEITDLANFGGDLVIEQGTVQIRPGTGFGTPAGATHVMGRDAALAISVQDTEVVSDDIYLHNGRGIGVGSALNIQKRFGHGGTPLLRLEGALHLGEEGATIGGEPGRPQSYVDFEVDVVTGGDLILPAEHLRTYFRTPNALYDGTTDLQAGSIHVEANGTLQHTSDIAIRQGVMRLQTPAGVVGDRVGDSIPISLYGGDLHIYGTGGEVLGKLTLARGTSTLELDDASVKVQQLERRPGATGLFDLDGQLLVEETANLTGSIIPWLSVWDEFTEGSYGTTFGRLENGRIRGMHKSEFVSSFAGADATSHVRIVDSASLESDLTINSLSAGGSSVDLDLNGNRLTIESGGVLLWGALITDGEMTAGASSDYELIFHYSTHVYANIVDNGEHAVSVVAGGVFYGNNSYSGTTYVDEDDLTLMNENALPSGTDLVISRGIVTLEYNGTSPKQLGKIHISEGGELTARFQGQNEIEFEEMTLESGSVNRTVLTGSGTIRKTGFGVASLGGSTTSTYSGQVIIEEGRLDAGQLNSASFLVKGGELRLGGSAPVELAGGDLVVLTTSHDPYAVTSPIHVSAPSRIVGEGLDQLQVSISGELTGDGPLTFLGRWLPEPRQFHRIGVSSSNPEFSGKVTIDSVLVSLQNEQSAGTGDIHVKAGGILGLAPRLANEATSKLDLANDVYLHGGGVLGIDTPFGPQRLFGNLFVNGHSQISTVDVVGTTHLADKSTLTTYGVGLTRFEGPIKVGGYAEIEYGTTLIESNSSGVLSGVVQIGGTITSDAENAVLNLVGRGLDTLALNASYHAAPSQSLTILRDGKPVELALSGQNVNLGGNGTIGNAVSLAEGATLAPGDSPGTLHFADDLTISSGAIYKWEIAEATAAPGIGWDTLSVDGRLSFAATADLPWILEIHDLAGTIPFEDSQWLIASASDGIVEFDPAMVQIVAAGFSGPFDRSQADRFTLHAEGSALYLVLSVPEPAAVGSLCLALCVGMYLVKVPQRRGKAQVK